MKCRDVVLQHNAILHVERSPMLQTESNMQMCIMAKLQYKFISTYSQVLNINVISTCVTCFNATIFRVVWILYNIEN